MKKKSKLLVFSQFGIGMSLIEAIEYSQADFFQQIKVIIIGVREVRIEVEYFFYKDHEGMYVHGDYLRQKELDGSAQQFKNSNEYCWRLLIEVLK